MSERADNIRFFLDSKEFGKVRIGDIASYRNVGGDTYKLEDEGYFSVSRKGRITMYEKGYEYLLGVLLAHGPSTKVKLITEKKSDLSLDEPWTVISDPFINLYTLDFNEEQDNNSVDVELVQGGDLKIFKESFDDEFDVVGPNVPELPYVNVRLDARSIIKRSRFINSLVEAEAPKDQGDTARALPLELDYTSEPQFIGEVSNFLANSAGGGYADLTTSGNCFITNAPRDLVYTLSGKIILEKTMRSFGGSFARMDLVRYSGGQDTEYNEIIQPMGSFNPSNTTDIYIEYDFNDFELVVNAGDSIGIMVLTDAVDLGPLVFKFKSAEGTYLDLKTDTPYPVTYTKAVKPFDMFRHLGRIIKSDPEYRFFSSVFGPGGRHENKLLIHGTWLRNMPQVLNEGEEDERRLQANLSLEDLFEAYSILEPMRYDVLESYKGKPAFTVGAFKDIQQNFTAIRIGDTTDKFRLVEVNEKARSVIGENYYRKVKIGSNTSGGNYGAVNNLYSMCGYGEWKTKHRDSSGEYEATTDFRTGAEDIEVQRQFQFADNPDLDGDYDNDWFLFDAKWNGVEYEAVRWQDYFSEKPTNVYSPDTNYNWCFMPTELLRGHGYKINVGFYPDTSGFLVDPTGNCDLSVKTKRAGEDYITGNMPFPVSLLEKPRISPLMVEFEFPVNEELLQQLRGVTNGVDNKFGLIEIKYKGVSLKGRLFEATTDKIAKFKIIQSTI